MALPYSYKRVKVEDLKTLDDLILALFINNNSTVVVCNGEANLPPHVTAKYAYTVEGRTHPIKLSNVVNTSSILDGLHTKGGSVSYNADNPRVWTADYLKQTASSKIPETVSVKGNSMLEAMVRFYIHAVLGHVEMRVPEWLQ